MKQIESTALQAVGHNLFSRTLTVRFTSGAEYKYKRVSRRVYKQLLSAESKGSFFSRNIRNVYEFKRKGA